MKIEKLKGVRIALNDRTHVFVKNGTIDVDEFMAISAMVKASARAYGAAVAQDDEPFLPRKRGRPKNGGA